MKSTCEDKVRYATRQKAINAIAGKHRDSKRKHSSKTYFCGECGGYHIYTEHRKRIRKRRDPRIVVSLPPTVKREERLVIRNFSSKR